MRGVIAVILGGGRGERLRPLTTRRAKPAVPFAGKYRLVDVPISNCLHGGIERMFVLTQYQSASLNRHLSTTYRFDVFSSGHVEVLAAEQTDHGNEGSDWFHGTADAVRKQLHRVAPADHEDVLIVSGDQVYMMDLAALVTDHRVNGADVTIAATRCDRDDARRFGVMQIDDERRITGFAEKPQDDATIDSFAVPDPVRDLTHLASMGIYVFRAPVLEALLAEGGVDFGKHILPRSMDSHRLLAHPFVGYWEDVGTIESYHRVSLDLTEPVPAFNLFDEARPMYTRARFLPPAKLGEARIDRAILSDGSVIGSGCTVKRSVIGIRTIVAPGCQLENVVCAGAGTYDLGDERAAGGPPALGIGSGSILRNVILDRDVRVGAGVRLVNEAGVRDFEDEHIVVRDGIIVVAAGGIVPDGYTF